MNTYDVAVVGGRVAGASTALLLARAGARVALLDRRPYGSDTLSTHALMRAGVLQLTRWGLLDRVVVAGTPPVRRTTFHLDDRPPVRVTIRPYAGVDALYAPRRHVLDRILVDAAAEEGVDVWHQTPVTDLLRDETGRVSGVVATPPSGGSVAVPARVTVGADGTGSMVAREVAAPVLSQGDSSSAVLYRYLSDLDTDGYEWAYASGAAAGIIPTNAGESCVFVATSPDRLRRLRREGAEPAFDTVLGLAAEGSLADRVRAAQPSGRLRGWSGLPGYVRRSWGPGWALVGDAGYFKDPITTHGMTDALRDAELLTDALLAVLAGAPGAEALGGYQATRDRLSSRLFEVTEQVATYDWDLDRVQTLLRRVSSAMSDEVDHLQALPARPQAPGESAPPVGTDTVAAHR